MIGFSKNTPRVYYFNSNNTTQSLQNIQNFSRKLGHMIDSKRGADQELIILCVGSDRATGDCLGPIVGYKLQKLHLPDFLIYGSLRHPVHAKNLQDIILHIKKRHQRAFILAIDASLGVPEHVGYITLGEGALHPGIGVDKALPVVGDIHITGIVNSAGKGGQGRLQTTRLDTVMNLADFICEGIDQLHLSPALQSLG